MRGVPAIVPDIVVERLSRIVGLKLQSGYALPPFQTAAFPRLILIERSRFAGERAHAF